MRAVQRIVDGHWTRDSQDLCERARSCQLVVGSRGGAGTAEAAKNLESITS